MYFVVQFSSPRLVLPFLCGFPKYSYVNFFTVDIIIYPVIYKTRLLYYYCSALDDGFVHMDVCVAVFPVVLWVGEPEYKLMVC